MQDIVSAAERLRAVRQASRHFLTLWALESLVAQARGLDRMAVDLDRRTADPYNRDWSLLYRGSILDD